VGGRASFENRILELDLIAAAMKVCDRYGDSEAAREDMRQQCLELPPHLQADLLEHFTGRRAEVAAVRCARSRCRNEPRPSHRSRKATAVTHTTTELSVMSTETESAPSASGYEAVRFNAMKHGILSRYTVLSHENEADYESLVNSLMAEHLPAGATEQHLVEELASIIWRKRRVLQAEGATLNQGLKASSRNSATVVPAAVPFELGLSGEGTRIPDLMDLTPDEVMESQRESRAGSGCHAEGGFYPAQGRPQELRAGVASLVARFA
jgi:hypothetical protein